MNEWIELRDKRDRLRGRYHPGRGVLELVERQEAAYWPLGMVAGGTMVSRLRATEDNTASPHVHGETRAVSGRDGD